MKSAIAILTYNRQNTLKTCLEGITKHCSKYPIAVFEDGGCGDNTVGWLTKDRKQEQEDYMLEAFPWTSEKQKYEVFIGTKNLGVTGNTNRALAWFWNSGYDHLCLCNDDILVSGDFVRLYGEAHHNLGVHLLCMCDLPQETHKTVEQTYRGVKIKLLTRLTGIMMSLTRTCVETVGFYDARFGKFGEEHVDYTHRVTLSGLNMLDKVPVGGIDLVQDVLAHQEVLSSIAPQLKQVYDQEASVVMNNRSKAYKTSSHFRPFLTCRNHSVNAREKAGIRTDSLIGYTIVQDRSGAVPKIF